MIRTAALFLLGLLLLLPVSLPAAPAAAPAMPEGAEGIRSFSSEITIGLDRSLRVRETLKVNALGRAITHGLFRDLPARRPDGRGGDQPTRPRVLEALLDRSPLEYSVAAKGKAEVRVTLGTGDQPLEPGEHVFEWSYLMENMVDSDVETDRFTYNVTGDRLGLPVGQVFMRVTLPRDVEEPEYSAVQGPLGRKPGHMKPCPLDSRGGFNLKSNGALAQGHGVSLFLSWSPPEGDARDARGPPFRPLANRPTLVLLAGTILVTLCFALLLSWVQLRSPVVEDPRTGGWPPSVPPALAGLFLTVDRERSYFLATLVAMLARGQAFLARRSGGMELSPGETEPAPGSLEQVAAAALFTEGRPVLLASSGDPAVRARGAVMAWLGAEVGGKYLRNNDRIFFFGLMLAALVVGLAAWMAKSPVTVLVQAGGSAAAALILLPPLIRRATRSPATAKVLGWLGKNPRPIVGLLLLLLLLAHQVLSPVLPLSLALLLALAGVLVLFWHLLRRPTPAALALGEALEGYREFLGGKGTLEPGQEEDLDFFVRHLPFALALDLGPAWEERFEGALEARGVPPVLAPRDSLPPMAWKEYLEALRRAVGSGEHGPADRDGG